MTIIETHFDSAFSLMAPDGNVRRFGCCQHSDDESWRVEKVLGRFELVQTAGRDDGFKVLSREEIPGNTAAAFGYHDGEHLGWETLEQIAHRLESYLSPA